MGATPLPPKFPPDIWWYREWMNQSLLQQQTSYMRAGKDTSFTFSWVEGRRELLPTGERMVARNSLDNVLFSDDSDNLESAWITRLLGRDSWQHPDPQISRHQTKNSGVWLPNLAETPLCTGAGNLWFIPTTLDNKGSPWERTQPQVP